MNGQGRHNLDPFGRNNSLMSRQQQQQQQQQQRDPFALMNQMMGAHMNNFGGGFPNMMMVNI